MARGIDKGELADVARNRRDGGERLPPRDPCIIAGDPQSVDITVSTLPAKTQAGTPASEFFGTNGVGFIIPLGDFAGAAWSRSGRSSTGTGTDLPAIPMVPGVPIPFGRGRECYIRRSGQITASGTVSLIFYPISRDEDLDDPYLLAALAQAFGGGGGNGGAPAPVLPFPAATAIADNEANPTTTRVGANHLVWDPSGAGGWYRSRGAASSQDGLAATAGCQTVLAELMGFNDGTGYDRLRSRGDNADAIATTAIGALLSLVRLTGFNGATYDRLRSAGDNADAVAAVALGELLTVARSTVLNNRTNVWERMRQPDAYSDANTSAQGVDTSTTGVKLSITCPAGATIRVTSGHVWHAFSAGNVDVDLQLVPNGGVATTLRRYALALFASTGDVAELSPKGIRLTAGDVLQWNVVGAVASTLSNFHFSYEQTRFPI